MAEKYLWVSQTAEKWGVSKSWVYRLCRRGRVPGAFFRDGRWSVPEDAEKPLHEPGKRMKRLRIQRINLPRLPLRLSGDGDCVPSVTEKLFIDCAEYIIDFVDIAPGNGKTLFCALSHPHIRAKVICQSPLEYAFFTSLKEDARALYSKLSMMIFEYSACQFAERKEYYATVRDAFNAFDASADKLTLAADALFLCQTSSGGELVIGTDGRALCDMRKKFAGEMCDISDFLLLSELLSRAKIYQNATVFEDRDTIPEYATLHISPDQDSSGEYVGVTRPAERVFVL